MRLKLKEEPREWQKFTTVLMVIPVAASALLWHRGFWGPEMFAGVGAAAGLIVLVCWIWARPFRGFYRVGMTASFHVGQVMGMILLSVLFFALLTPLGWVLRLTGKDLLGLKRRNSSSYWRPSQSTTHFDRQF